MLVSAGLALACGLASLVSGVVLALLALSLLHAFGQGSFPLVATLLVARSFRGRRGQAMASASFGITAASVVLPPLAVALIVGLGWRDAYRMLGLAVLVLPLALFLRERRTEDGEGAAAQSEPRGPRALRKSRRLPRITVPTRRARRLLLVLAAPPLLMTAVIFHATAFLGEHGLSLGQAGAALSLIGVGSIAGTLLGGALADRISSRTLLVFMTGFLTAATLFLVLPTAPPAYLAFALLVVGGGVFGVAAGVVWPRTYGLAEIGRIQGASFSVQIAAAAGPLPLALSSRRPAASRPRSSRPPATASWPSPSPRAGASRGSSAPAACAAEGGSGAPRLRSLEVSPFLGRRAAGRRQGPADAALRLEARRGRALVEESREIVVVLDERGRVVTASRRARELLGGLEEGAPAPEALVDGAALAVPYDVDGRRETILYGRDTGDMAAYEELRAGFTAAVSHELRTPLARLLALLESALLPDADVRELVEQAQGEVDQIRELIDDILFLSELESGHEVVGLGTTDAFPIVAEVAEGLAEQAARAGVVVEVDADEDAELPLRPRMIRVIVQNLAQNAIRYAGPGSHLRLSLRQQDSGVVLEAADDGVGVSEDDLPRLFERFYRADRARASRGTGLGLAIVKHVVTSAGGTVEASGARGRGLTVRCAFPAAHPDRRPPGAVGIHQ